MAQTKDLKNFHFGNHTDVGKVRKQNEDYLGYFDTANGDVFVVCDGMGGHAGGMKASRVAVESIREFMSGNYVASPEKAIREAIRFANQQVYAISIENPEFRGMGTTCVLLLVRDGKVYYGHVGDSRIYLHSSGRLSRLTKDHSYVQKLVDQGVISEEDAESHPRRNELLNALGPYPEVEVAVAAQPVQPVKGDTFLLCSDGLTGPVSDRAIESVLNESISVQHKAIRLVELANEGGGHDNITVQLVSFYQPGTTAASSGSAQQRRNTMPLLVLGAMLLLAVAAGFYYFQQQGNKTSALISDTLRVDSLTKLDGVKTGVDTALAEPRADTLYYMYKLRPKDTFVSIAQRFMIPASVLQNVNQISLSDQLAKIKTLKIPVRARHVVRQKQIMDSLVNMYQVDRQMIIGVNQLKEIKGAVTLKPGDTILIPFIY